VLGFLGVLCLLVLVTILSYGVLLRPDLAALPTPAMAGVMAALVGPWGLIFISVGLLISILGNYLSWSLLAAEVLYAAARSGTMPAALARSSKNGVPSAALWSTNIVIQVFLIVSYFAEYAFHLALTMTSAMTLVPYVLVAGYGLKLAATGETYSRTAGSRRTDLAWAGIATVYTASMLMLGGVRYLLLASIILSIGSVLYFLSPRRPGEPMLRPAEMALLAVIVLAGLTGIGALITGSLSI
jgi:arginine:ornithine antiporter / lysine permease